MKPPEPDTAFEISLRPPAFSEFTGQVKVRERLELMVEAAKKRGHVRGNGKRAAAFPFRHDRAARLLSRRGNAEDHRPQCKLVRRGDRPSGRGGDCGAVTRNTADGQQSVALGSRLRAGES